MPAIYLLTKFLVEMYYSGDLAEDSASAIVSDIVQLVALVEGTFKDFVTIYTSSLEVIFTLPTDDSPKVEADAGSPTVYSMD